ncbi:hypothetical protein R80B4_00966 [Fibrobacteres bacterium R8-0-B4]
MNGGFPRKERKGRATERKRRITVLRVTRERTEGGFAEPSETRNGPYWASVEPISESLRVKYQSVSVNASHSVTVDGAADVIEGDVIEFAGRRFDVLTVRRVDEGRRDKIIITQEIRPGQKK